MDKNVLFSISTAVAALSVVINSLFIYISCKKERKSIGAYRYLLVAFATCNILHSSVEYIAKPVHFIYGHSILSFNNGPLTIVPTLEPFVIGLLFSMHGMESALLVLHFLYRYIIVCRPEKKKYFEGFKLVIWAAFNLVWGLIYFFVAFHGFAPTKECYDYAGTAVRNTFHSDLNELPHMCILAYEVISNSLHIYWKTTLGLAVMTMMTIVTFIAMTFLGVQTLRTIRRTALSKKTIKLQRQMLIALTIQAVLPCVLAFMPRFIMLYSALLELSLPSVFKYLPLITTFSTTVIDPVAVMLTIKEYRNAIFGMIMNPTQTPSAATTTAMKVLTHIRPQNHHLCSSKLRNEQAISI